MKIVLFILSLALSTQAFSKAAGCYDKVDLKEIGSKTPAWKCKDGTVSFSQNTRYSNKKEKKDDYESLCGAVAAANVFHAYCDAHFVNHVSIASKYFSDITPGIRPDTLEDGLNQMFDNNSECMGGEWKYYYSKNRWDFLNSLYVELRRGHSGWNRLQEDGSRKNRAPVIVLIAKSYDADILHYVTVVDIIGYDRTTKDYESEKCKVIYNDFGSQKERSCSTFVKWAHQVDNNTFTGWMPEYIHLVFEEGYISRALRTYKEKIEHTKKMSTSGLKALQKIKSGKKVISN